jgi:hypothetical protein
VPTQVLTYFAFNAAGFLEFHAPASVNCPGATSAGACGQRFFLTFHIALLPRWISTQMSARFICFSEALRNAGFAAATLLMSHRDGSLTPALAVLVVAEAVLCFVYGLFAVKLCRAATFEERHLPRVATCPRCFVPAREWFVSRVEASARRLLDEPAIDFHTVTGLVASCVLLGRVFRVESLFVAAASGNIMFLTLTLSALAGKLQGGTTRSLRLMARRLGLGTEQRALFDLRSRLADLPSEAAIICAASEALRELLPDASASAVATFCLEHGAGGESRKSYRGGGRLAGLEAAAVSESMRAALEAAALTTGNALGTSVAFACRHATTRGSHLAWSSDFTPGLAAFADDWRAAASRARGPLRAGGDDAAGGRPRVRGLHHHGTSRHPPAGRA